MRQRTVAAVSQASAFENRNVDGDRRHRRQVSAGRVLLCARAFSSSSSPRRARLFSRLQLAPLLLAAISDDVGSASARAYSRLLSAIRLLPRLLAAALRPRARMRAPITKSAAQLTSGSRGREGAATAAVTLDGRQRRRRQTPPLTAHTPLVVRSLPQPPSSPLAYSRWQGGGGGAVGTLLSRGRRQATFLPSRLCFVSSWIAPN